MLENVSTEETTWRSESYCPNELDLFFISGILQCERERSPISVLTTCPRLPAATWVCSGERFYWESHAPSCACSPAEDQQSSSHVCQIIIFYASGMYPLIKECHLNWGFASLHMAGWACVPQEKQVQHHCSQEGFKPFWGPVQQRNSSRNRNKRSFSHLLSTSSYNKCYVSFGTKIRSRLLFYSVLLI